MDIPDVDNRLAILFLEGNSCLEFLEDAIKEPENSFSTCFVCTL
jgi:hypothetical protein